MAITTPSELAAWRIYMGLKPSDVAQMFGISELEEKQMEGAAATKPIHEGIVRLSRQRGT